MKKHFSKIFILSLLTSTTVLTSCYSDNESYVLDSSEEYNIKNNAFLKEFSVKAKGTWNVEKMSLVPNTISDIYKNDTILYNVGKIYIDTVDKTHPKETRTELILNANFLIKDEIIPFSSSRLLPFWFSNYAIALMSVNPEYFPEPYMNFDELPEEYKFLAGYFFHDNYEMTFSEDGKTLIWKGTNRSVKEIILTKID